MDSEKEKGIEEILSSVSLKDHSFRRKEEIGALLAREREKQRCRLKCRRRTYCAWGSVAASVLVFIITVWIWKYNEVIIEARQQEKAVCLPDGSDVELMQHSGLRYNRLKWYFSRDLYLSGSASFAVVKGSAFTVDTRVGKVSVLGTKFKIVQQGDGMLVDCMEGSVRLETASDNKVLEAGQSADCTPQGIVFVEKPEYLIYNNTPLEEVMEKMESVYQIFISPKEICRGILYTGGVSTMNLEEALEVVCGSCNLSYSIEGNNIRLKKK